MKKIFFSIAVLTSLASSDEIEMLIKATNKLIDLNNKLENRVSVLEKKINKDTKLSLELKYLKNEISSLKQEINAIQLSNANTIQTKSNIEPIEENFQKLSPPPQGETVYPIITTTPEIRIPPEYYGKEYIEPNSTYSKEKIYNYVVYLGFFKTKYRANKRYFRLKKIEKNVLLKYSKRKRRYSIILRYNSTRSQSLQRLKKLRRIVPDLFYKKYKQ